MGKPILRLDTIHKNREFTEKMRHNYRLDDVENADPEKMDKNRSLIDLPEGEDYLGFFKKKVKELPYYDDHSLRKNGVRGYEIMLAFGDKDLPEDFDVNEWAEVSKNWLISEYGEENIASAVLHMDEKNPHIHAVVVPVVDGKIKSMYPERQDMRDLHKRYDAYIQEVGLEKENEYMHIGHEPIGKFYNSIDKAMQKSLPEPEKDEDAEQYFNRANAFYKDEVMKDEARQHELKQAKKEKKAAEKANQTLSKLLDEKNEEIETRLGSMEHAETAVNFYDSIAYAIEKADKSDNEQEKAAAAELVSTLQGLHDTYAVEKHAEENVEH